MRIGRGWVVLVVGALAGGCGPESGGDRAQADGGAVAVQRPETVRRPVTIEGMQESMEFRLVRSPDGFSLPFSTYVPADMEPEFSGAGADGVVHFRARFGGVVNERAGMTVHVHPPKTLVRQAQQQLAAYLSGLYPDDIPDMRGSGYETTVPVEPASRYPWAVEESRYRVPGGQPGETIVGRAGVGSHGERVFHYIIEYPAEFGDGMGPRVDAILEEWRWTETGQGLGGA
jgi:hypothetical protein